MPERYFSGQMMKMFSTAMQESYARYLKALTKRMFWMPKNLMAILSVI